MTVNLKLEKSLLNYAPTEINPRSVELDQPPELVEDRGGLSASKYSLSTATQVRVAES